MGAKVGVSKGVVSDMNLTPLIDIVLVVLIIMMVNIPIQIEEMGLKLPAPELPDPPPPPNPDQLVLAIYEDARVALNRRVMNDDVLIYEMTRRLGPMSAKNVFVDAGAKVPYGQVVHYVDLARQAGATMVGMAKIKETGPLEPLSVAPGAMPRGVVLGTPRVVGGIDQVAAASALAPLKASFESCYATRLAAVPDLSGRLQIKTTIGPKGEHMEPPTIIEGSTIDDAELVACITPLLPNIRYAPLGPDKTAVALYPVLFSPGLIVDGLAPHLARLEARLAGRFHGVWPAPFQAALDWPTASGGKRIRPAICFAAARAVGADPIVADAAAEAIELVHTYSLVHDDLPAMDDDAMRRGRPTVHKQFDEATAILVGDGLLTEAFSVLAEAPLPPAHIVGLVGALARAAGVHGMVGGQVGDISPPGRDLDTVLRIHARKTGALIRAAAEMGGVAAGARPDHLAALATYGTQVGLAFQLADDTLDHDEDDGAPSVSRLLGRPATLARAEAAATEALAAIAPLPDPGWLTELAWRAVRRSS